ASESRELKPQAVLYIGAPASLAKVRVMLQDAGITVPLLFASDSEHLATLQADSKSSNGIFLATSYVLEQDTAEIAQFVKRYQERFGEVPTADALLAYDGVRVLLQAMRKAES